MPSINNLTRPRSPHPFFHRYTSIESKHMPSSDFINNPLTPVQEQVLTAIANGASMGEAAAQVSLHRNTVGNWRRTSQPFRDALTKAQYDRCLQIHEQAVTLVTEAVSAVREILRDPSAPASVRLKAALAILQQASTPPPEPPVAVTNEHKDAQVAQPPELVCASEKHQESSLRSAGQPRKSAQICTIIHRLPRRQGLQDAA